MELFEALSFSDKEIISFAGRGGKTTLFENINYDI